MKADRKQYFKKYYSKHEKELKRYASEYYCTVYKSAHDNSKAYLERKKLFAVHGAFLYIFYLRIL